MAGFYFSEEYDIQNGFRNTQFIVIISKSKLDQPSTFQKLISNPIAFIAYSEGILQLT